MLDWPSSRLSITKKAETNASIYAGTVPCMDGMSTNEVSGITLHQSGINQRGKPLIGLKNALILFLAQAREAFSKLETVQWAMGAADSAN
jgi:hypothetical protein